MNSQLNFGNNEKNNKRRNYTFPPAIEGKLQRKIKGRETHEDKIASIIRSIILSQICGRPHNLFSNNLLCLFREEA